MISLTYTNIGAGGEDSPLQFTVEAPTLLQALGKIEAYLEEHVGHSNPLLGDGAFDVTVCVRALENRRTYKRERFSTPEDSFTLEMSGESHMYKKEYTTQRLSLDDRERIAAIIKRKAEEYGEHPYQINNGSCSRFAADIEECFEGAVETWGGNMPQVFEALPIDDDDHSFIKYKGWYFDAEEPYGVPHPVLLPLFMRQVQRAIGAIALVEAIKVAYKSNGRQHQVNPVAQSANGANEPIQGSLTPAELRARIDPETGRLKVVVEKGLISLLEAGWDGLDGEVVEDILGLDAADREYFYMSDIQYRVIGHRGIESGHDAAWAGGYVWLEVTADLDIEALEEDESRKE